MGIQQMLRQIRLWPRIDETFGEDPQIISDIIFRIMKGFQGDILNEDSVTTTVRHYPGGGARYKGKDPHFEEGRLIFTQLKVV